MSAMDRDMSHDPSQDADSENWDELNAEAPDEGLEDGTPDQSYESGDEGDQELDQQRAEVVRQEKERLRQMEQYKKTQLEKMRHDNASAASGEAARADKRLQFLLKQAEVFQHFAPSQQAEGQRKKAKKRGRHGDMDDEAREDAELLRDEETSVQPGHRLMAQPTCIKGKMREYQMQGLNWLIHLYDNGISGILADEMGLGKTLQTISLMGYLHEYRGINGPHLIIVPKSTLHNWMNELRKWCPVLRATKFHGNQEERMHQKDVNMQPGKFDVVVTSYEMVIKEKNHFKKYHWRYIIIDEAHRIKNENSILSRTVRLFKTNYRLLITGTPLQNNLHELWALLNFLLPEVFATAEKFDEWFALGKDDKSKEAEVVEQLHKVLRPFLLRRLKADVEKSLPPKKETILKIAMSTMQKKWYASILNKDMDAVAGQGADRSRLLNIVMQLRKCCNHPYLFQGAEPGPPYTTGDHLVENAGKMLLLDKLLPRLRERGSRVLIFSQMTRMLDVLEDYSLFKGHAYCRIDGNTSGEDRESQIDNFNADGSEKFIFLLSTRAGGLGINLYTADVVVLYDSDWNPQMDLQAMDRAHRIGQKKEVQVFRFCTENSIEEKVIEKALKKLRLDAMVIQQGRMSDNNAKTVNKDDLLQMVRYGAEMVFSGGSAAVTDEDIDAIIRKGEQETSELNAKLAQFTEKAMKFTMDGGVSYDSSQHEDDSAGINAIKKAHVEFVKNAPKEERQRRTKIDYSMDAAFRATQGKGRSQNEKRLPKMPNLQDFQFYDRTRLEEIYEKEHQWDLHEAPLKERATAMRKQGASDEAIEAEMVARRTDSDPEPLSSSDIKERDELLGQGFSNWGRRDFQAFVKACARHGRNALADITREVEGKSEEEVRAYSKVFWARHREIGDWEKHVKNIEAGEARIQRQSDIMNAIAVKMDRYKNPWQELRLQYGANKGKAYTEDEDRFILCQVHQLGYGAWDELKAAIRENWRFRFDWFFKSRTPQELMRRCDTLIRLVEKENEDLDVDAGKRTGGRRAVSRAGTTDSSGAVAAGGKKRKASTPAPAGGAAKKAK